jgi:hypothetical protein
MPFMVFIAIFALFYGIGIPIFGSLAGKGSVVLFAVAFCGFWLAISPARTKRRHTTYRSYKPFTLNCPLSPAPSLIITRYSYS